MNKKQLKKIGIVVAIIALIAAFRFFHLDHYFTLSYIKGAQEKFQILYSGNHLLVIGIYMLIYILVAALSLPGAAVMTLLGGAIFGLLVGTVAVSFASTIGATLACFVSRYLLRDWVQGKFGDKLHTINEGITREGPFYLFTLRLIPAFPFFVINLVMGLTKMRLWTFYWVSQVGMLAGTIVFVNGGKELAKINSLKGILSPRLIISFVILGLFPLTVKKLMALYKSRRANPLGTDQ